MGSVDPKSLRAVVNAILGQPPRDHDSGASDEADKNDSVVSRRDERGMPYRGDFPNPASDRTKGCF